MGVEGIDLNVKESTYSVDGIDDHSYNYMITTVDHAGNEAVSDCSNTMKIDFPPLAATSLEWGEKSPYKHKNVTAVWNVSVSGDISRQLIKIFNGKNCDGELLFEEKTGLNSKYYFKENDGDYSYKIVSIDKIGNKTTSKCSTTMTIDTIPPIISVDLPMGAHVGHKTGTNIFGSCSEPDRDVVISGDVAGHALCKSNNNHLIPAFLQF